MRIIDISDKVMDRIYTWEKQRVAWWQRWFMLVLLVPVIVFGGLVWAAGQRVAERQTLELLTLLTQDREIIAEFWQDTLMVIAEELPWKSIVLGMGVGISIVTYLLLTRERQRVIQRKLQQLAEYQKRKYGRRTI